MTMRQTALPFKSIGDWQRDLKECQADNLLSPQEYSNQF